MPDREISPSSAWNTSETVGHFKKEHPHPHSAHKQQAKLVVLNVTAGEQGQPRVAAFFAPREVTVSSAALAPALQTETVVLNDPPPAQYDLIGYLLDTNMFKVYSDMMRSETLLIQERKPTKFGYLPMMMVVRAPC